MAFVSVAWHLRVGRNERQKFFIDYILNGKANQCVCVCVCVCVFVSTLRVILLVAMITFVKVWGGCVS